MHGAYPFIAGLFAMQQMQEMPAYAVVVGLYVDVVSVMAEVVPLQQRRTQIGHQTIRDIAGIGQIVVVFFGQGAAQHGNRRSADHTSELTSLMLISYAVF